jgi:hypothetical protein
VAYARHRFTSAFYVYVWQGAERSFVETQLMIILLLFVCSRVLGPPPAKQILWTGRRFSNQLTLPPSITRHSSRRNSRVAPVFFHSSNRLAVRRGTAQPAAFTFLFLHTFIEFPSFTRLRKRTCRETIHAFKPADHIVLHSRIAKGVVSEATGEGNG